MVLEFTEPAGASAWWAARTPWSHSGAVFVVVDGLPVRGPARSPAYFVDYLDWLRGLVEGGFFDGEEPTDDAALLGDIAAARAIFERVHREAAGEEVPVPEAPAAPLAAAALLAVLWLARRRSRAAAQG